ncbi:MAG: dTDP-glucose 4,6-dehydratase, partial [Candidatus Komeilibacteria bacterium]|nr:dTDP-glucose 4,6-dehydratase [Candidatus Komeilibacteria bacterium]MBT4447158.1 dTDP-glucose 4,6-dehydratase [Candidatus Komeilibacteria bacterium]
NIRDWLFVTDHCQAIDLIIHQGKIGETYLIGGDAEKTNLEITNLLINKLAKDESLIERVEDRLGHDYRYAIDFSKISKELGWQPSVSFEEGIDKTIEWYKNNNDL